MPPKVRPQYDLRAHHEEPEPKRAAAHEQEGPERFRQQELRRQRNRRYQQRLSSGVRMRARIQKNRAHAIRKKLRWLVRFDKRVLDRIIVSRIQGDVYRHSLPVTERLAALEAQRESYREEHASRLEFFGALVSTLEQLQ